MVLKLPAGNDVIRSQDSPPSTLRNAPSCVASQMAPRPSTNAELITDTDCGSPGANQPSPPFMDATIPCRLTATSARPSEYKLIRSGISGPTLRHDCPESWLTSKPIELAAYNLPSKNSSPRTAAVSSPAGSWPGAGGKKFQVRDRVFLRRPA